MKSEEEVKDMLNAYVTEINNGSRRATDRYWAEALKWVLEKGDDEK